MSVFVRRFLTDPGNVVLLDIESVNVLDLNPPGAIQGVGAGTVLIVGEFENGAFAAPTQVISPNDLVTGWGSIGYQYGSLPGQNPCARSRKADNAIVPEYWNGNAVVQLNAKQFSELLVCRVDTRVGNVVVQRLAYLTGAAAFRYALQTGQVLQLDVGAGPTSATFTGTVATVDASGGTYPTTFTGGQTLTLQYDEAPEFTVTFLSTDQSLAQVLARINQYAGFAFAGQSGSQLTLTGLVGGLAGQVQVVSGSSGVLAQLGLTAGTTLGGGNVQNIAAVAPTEIATIVQAAISNTKVEQDQTGALRISNTGTTGFIVVGSGTTATGLGFLAGTEATDQGEPILVSGAGTYPLTHTGTVTFQLGAALAPISVTITGSMTLGQFVTAANAAATAAGQGTPFTADGAAAFYAIGPNPGDTIQVVSASAGNVLTELGLTVGTTYGVLPPMGVLPAGTVVQVPNGTQFVTMQDVTFAPGQVTVAGAVVSEVFGGYSVPIRHALDDGTGTGVTAGAITQIATPPAIGAFSVVNPQIVTNALTEAQIDAQYATAIAATVSTNNVAQTTNIIFSARQSNAVRMALRNNALQASTSGCYGRIAIIRTPLNLPEATALSLTAQPGVGAYYNGAVDRVVYCYPQANTTVPIIALVGVAGGEGFNATGAVDVGADGFLASICSQLPPEENPGQVTPYTTGINGLESGANIQGANDGSGFLINDYIAFKAAGICALRMDNGVAIFQSGVTCVNPQLYSNLTDINRRRMADFLQDSIATSLKVFGKKLQTNKRRKAIRSEVYNFLNGLAGGGSSASSGNPNSEDSQRIDSFSIDDTSANTPQLTGLGLWRIILAVRTLSDFKSIVLQTTVGPTVQVADISPQNVAQAA